VLVVDEEDLGWFLLVQVAAGGGDEMALSLLSPTTSCFYSLAT